MIIVAQHLVENEYEGMEDTLIDLQLIEDFISETISNVQEADDKDRQWKSRVRHE